MYISIIVLSLTLRSKQMSFNINSKKTIELYKTYSQDPMVVDSTLAHDANMHDSDEYAEQIEQQFLHELASTRYTVYESFIYNQADRRKKYDPDADRVRWEKRFITLDLAEAQSAVAEDDGVYRIVEEKIL